MNETAERKGINWLRLRALAVALPLLAASTAVGAALLDPAIERAIEDAGADIVGAKVDVDGVDFQPGEGRVVLGRLQVGHPESPFLNLMEAREVVVDLRIGPLLEKKIVADSFVMRGIRFGTPRETSGVLENPNPESGRLWREVNAWAEGLNVPALSLEGLSNMVNTEAIADDSLATLRFATSLASNADSLTAHWQAEIARLDPRPVLDSARTLSARVDDARRTRPNVLEVTRLVRSTRAMATRLAALQANLKMADSTARSDVAGLRGRLDEIQPSIEADLAYGRRLLRLPSLEAPALSPILFRETALTWLKPVLYWVHTAERYLPPGLDPSRRPGPLRRRAPGTTVAFPGRARYPEFLLERGALDLEINGTGLEAGRYDGVVEGLSSAPALSQQPLRIEVRRTGAPRGPEAISVMASLNHARRPLEDSVQVGLGGVALPNIDLPDFGSRLVLGTGEAEFALVRMGNQIDASMRWVADDMKWEGQPVVGADSSRIGSGSWTRAFVWRSLRNITRLELEMGLSGSLNDPTISVRSNLGSALALSLREEVGEEVRRAELQVRGEVERRIRPAISEARAGTAKLEELVTERLLRVTEEIADLRSRLEQAAADLVRRPD